MRGLLIVFSLNGLIACGSDPAEMLGTGGAASGGQASTGGTWGSGGLNASGGAVAAGGSLASSGGGASGSATGGASSTGGNRASGGGTGDVCAQKEPLAPGRPLDCGDAGVVLADMGRPENRVNYIIVGDGYTRDQLDTVYLEHIQNMLEHQMGMFGDFGEPYVRYRKFINICALKVESQEGCVDDHDTGLECDTALDGYGDDASRLGIVDNSKVQSTIAGLLPDSVDVDWTGVTINAGADNWWNSGGAVMVWNGGYQRRGDAASVALHEGGHAFHGLADEYDGQDQNCDRAPEPNVSTDDSGADWSEWLGFDHDPGTGLHGSFEGARYCAEGIYRPTQNSEMNRLPDYFNMPSVQKIIHDIYEVVQPIDDHTDNSTPLTNPDALQVRLVDSDVVSLQWLVDGEEQSEASGECFATDGLSEGEHVVSARAFDETEWVRQSLDGLEQTVSWNITITRR